MSINCAPHRFILLTGAGFSYPFGGFLALEFWERLVRRRQVQARSRVRDLLLTEQSFEQALARVRAEAAFDDEDVVALESAILEVFEGMDGDIADSNIWRDAPANIYGFQEFLRKFQCSTQDNSANAGFIFTLNQDLMLERKWYNFDHWSYPVAHPGVPISMRMHANGHHWFSTIVGRLDESMDITLDESEGIEFAQRTNYVKLHGSLNWRTADGRRALVIGTGKTQQIEMLPLLSQYAAAFEEVLMTPNRRLMIAGYSFEDEHINKVISRAAREADLEIHIWDPSVRNLIAKIEARSDCVGILTHFAGPWSRKLHEVFPYNQAKTSEWTEMQEKFFRD